MEKIIVDRCRWKNAVAFMEVNSETGEVTIRGKFYDGGRGFPGPETGVLATCSASLLKEIVDIDNLFPVEQTDARSQELKDFIFETWKKGAAANSWFDY